MSTTSEIGSVQLGHRLAQLRERANMKQAELARQVTWSPAVLSRIEAGERIISDEELKTLLEAIGTSEASELATVLDRDWQHLPQPTLDHPDQHLLWKAEQMTVALEDVALAPDVRPAFQHRLREYVDEISNLASLLLRREHQIAFIGSIGIGKSTAICRVTGLETFGPQGRLTPVLEAGSGGITLCEVHLRVGPESGFGVIVEPRTHDDIRSDVEDFVDQLLRVESSVIEEDGAPAVPREIDRAIRNMAGLTRTRTKGPDGKTMRTDPARALAAEIPLRRDLVVEILTRMGLHRRDRREEWYSPALAASPLEWMKTTFEQINNGRHSEFSLPQRIDLIVPQLLEIGDLDVSIVDTRGIDQLSARADLESLLEDPHTVSILCSGFNEVPAPAIQHLLRRARDINNTQIDSHVSVLVLPHPGQALAVKDETGALAQTSDDGYYLKGEEASTALISFQMGESPVLFFNAFEDEPDLFRSFLCERVMHTRNVFRRQLDDVLTRTRLLLENAEQEQVLAIQRDAGRHLAAWIKQHPAPAQIDGHVYDPLFDEIENAHASTVHAAVRREGEWRSLSYSHQLGHGARKLAVVALHGWVTDFSGHCNTLRASMTEAAELLSQADRLMSAAYEELLRKVQLTGLTVYRDHLRQDPQFWLDNAEEWGRGPGYRNRVLRKNRDWFQRPERQELEAQLAEVLRREWAALLNRVGSIFEVS